MAKPTTDEYLKFTLRELVERGNNNTNESELPFIAAVISANAAKDQKLAAKKMYYASLAMLLVAVISMVSPFVIHHLNSKNNSLLYLELESLKSEYKSLRAIYNHVTSDQIDQSHKIQYLESQIEKYELQLSQLRVSKNKSEHNKSLQVDK